MTATSILTVPSVREALVGVAAVLNIDAAKAHVAAGTVRELQDAMAQPVYALGVALADAGVADMELLADESRTLALIEMAFLGDDPLSDLSLYIACGAVLRYTA